MLKWSLTTWIHEIIGTSSNSSISFFSFIFWGGGTSLGYIAPPQLKATRSCRSPPLAPEEPASQAPGASSPAGGLGSAKAARGVAEDVLTRGLEAQERRAERSGAGLGGLG